MKVSVLASLVLLAAAGPVAAYDKPGELAAGPALARINKGKLVLRRPAAGPVQVEYFYEPVTSYPADGRPVTSYVLRKVPKAAPLEYPAGQVKAFDLRGNALKLPELKRRLAEETPVLVINDAKAVDPLLARLLKEDTVLLVLPLPQAPAAPEPSPAR